MKRELIGCVGRAAGQEEGVRWQVWDDDSEFGAEEESQVEHPSPGDRGVTAGEATERIVHDLVVWVGADPSRD